MAGMNWWQGIAGIGQASLLGLMNSDIRGSQIIYRTTELFAAFTRKSPFCKGAMYVVITKIADIGVHGGFNKHDTIMGVSKKW